MNLINIVSEAVLSLKLPGEEATSIKSGEVNLVLARYPSNKLGGMRVEGGNRTFQLPTSDDLLVKTKNASFVDVQVGTVSCKTNNNNNNNNNNKVTNKLANSREGHLTKGGDVKETKKERKEGRKEGRKEERKVGRRQRRQRREKRKKRKKK